MRSHVACVLAAILVVPVTAPAARLGRVYVSSTQAAPQLAAVSDAPSTLARQVYVRGLFGLDTSPSQLGRAAAQAPLNASIALLGIPLTDSEEKAISQRLSLQPSIAQYAQQLNQLPGFAGLYVDQAAGGRIELLFAGLDQQVVVNALAAKPPGTITDVRQVSYSLRYLQAVQTRMASDWPRLDAQGFAISGIGIDIAHNRVSVGLNTVTADFAEALTSSYGPAIEVLQEPGPEPFSCVSRSNCANPLKAALQIYNATRGIPCASGFVASDGFGGDAYLITAGHCLYGSFTHNGSGIGQVIEDSYYNWSQADAEVINISDTQRSNEIYQSPTSVLHITARQSYLGDYVGEAVCISSYYYGNNCGTITDNEYDAHYSGLYFQDQRRANYLAHGGDSGGPIYVPGISTAAGITTAGWADDNCIYSQINWVEVDVPTTHGLKTCLNMTCS